MRAHRKIPHFNNELSQVSLMRHYNKYYQVLTGSLQTALNDCTKQIAWFPNE